MTLEEYSLLETWFSVTGSIANDSAPCQSAAMINDHVDVEAVVN
jgi:hypothetical protein